MARAAVPRTPTGQAVRGNRGRADQSNRPAAFFRSDPGTGHHVVEQVGLCGPELDDEGQRVEQAEKFGRVLGGPTGGAHVIVD